MFLAMVVVLISAPPMEFTLHQNVESAALESLANIPDSQFEYGGAVLFCDNQNFKGYVSTQAVTSNDSHAVSHTISAPPEWGCQIAAFYHTHPASNTGSRMFSEADIRVSEKFKVPSYIYIVKENTVRVHVPGVSRHMKVSFTGHKEMMLASFGQVVTRSFKVQAP